ncbi:hypothetical protein PHYBOEH_007856 [Phytophthora boehmeriae]|uniref:5-aminolevulinate synthase presequence domain-containing protein n=1 Tax=Phytophthora boehmeriae TaxID=109152 RepID=A0A8T1W8E7_9STRA|nr:hypothetical protein PHYBOEH_007856 [Phytophthora boehmeriae]
MAIAKPIARVSGSNSEVSHHKRGHSLLFLAHHCPSMDLSRPPTSSRQSKHKHHSRHRHDKQHRQNDKTKSGSSTPVYDRCQHEAKKLKTRILLEHRERPTRFRLSAMKRVVIPPVNIPQKIAQKRGNRDVVSGKSVPFTKAMWEAQKKTYSKSHGLPVIFERLSV